MPAGRATSSGAATGDTLVVAEASSLEELRDDWERLVQDDIDVFRSWEWAKAWELAAGTAQRRLLTFTPSGSQMVGIARLAELRSAPVRMFAFEGQGPADQVGPVCHPRDRAAVAQALRATPSGPRSCAGFPSSGRVQPAWLERAQRSMSLSVAYRSISSSSTADRSS